eukprot:GHVU01059619.1.p1 GENE.GHVU01059619.1~~GHVU01059619.1.p1  ORF type:complete len:110 (+),score=10.28 GHVU01059619.1:304-633(+)
MNFRISDALFSLRPGAEFAIRGGVIDFYQHNDPQPTAEELQAEIARLEAAQPMVELRQQRNRLIAETDYLALSDATMTDDMKTYRQTLRDLPANTTDPANPVWPTKPGA